MMCEQNTNFYSGEVKGARQQMNYRVTNSKLKSLLFYIFLILIPCIIEYVEINRAVVPWGLCDPSPL
jgi:predicted RND superfamily exporter protein